MQIQPGEIGRTVVIGRIVAIVRLAGIGVVGIGRRESVEKTEVVA